MTNFRLFLGALLLGLVAAALAGCSKGDPSDKNGSDPQNGTPDSEKSTGSSFDLDTKSAFWTADARGKVLVLYTYKGSSEVLIDVRDQPKGSTQGQFTGSRTGDGKSGYALELDCLNKASPSCDLFGNTLSLSCSMGVVDGDDAELVCGSWVFQRVPADDIVQD